MQQSCLMSIICIVIIVFRRGTTGEHAWRDTTFYVDVFWIVSKDGGKYTLMRSQEITYAQAARFTDQSSDLIRRQKWRAARHGQPLQPLVARLCIQPRVPPASHVAATWNVGPMGPSYARAIWTCTGIRRFLVLHSDESYEIADLGMMQNAQLATGIRCWSRGSFFSWDQWSINIGS